MYIFLIIICLAFIFWEPISRWTKRAMARRAEAILRKAMGMPPPPGKKKNNRKSYKSRRGQKKTTTRPDPATLMKRVAEDVEFTEIREFTSETDIEFTGPEGRKIRVVTEEQVTDAEYVEIKTHSGKK